MACPECGGEFRPQGLAGHRRLKHGIRRDATASEPAPALPTQQPKDLASTLEELCRHVARVDERLGRLEQSVAAARNGEQESEIERLKNELACVLDDIERVKAETDRDPGSDDMRRQLGELRKRQAHVLYLMGSAAPGGEHADIVGLN